jgi:hypothetical protein
MPTYDVLLKNVDPLLVASVRDNIPIISERGHLYETLSAYLDREGVLHWQPDLLLLHSRHRLRDEEMSIDVEVAVPIPAILPVNEQVSIRTLAGGLMASTVHIGDDLSLARCARCIYNVGRTKTRAITSPKYNSRSRNNSTGPRYPFLFEAGGQFDAAGLREWRLSKKSTVPNWREKFNRACCCVSSMSSRTWPGTFVRKG